jgi:hypothetical protein
VRHGDYVIAEPVSEEFAATHPTVTGTLELDSFEFMGNTETTHQVRVKWSDGTEALVDVKEDTIKPASPRRHPETKMGD